MAANGALVKARRVTTACWILLVTETETIANSLDAPSGAEREGTIPINPISQGARQGMKCAAQMKLLSPKSRLRLGTWNVRTMYEQGRCAQIVKEMLLAKCHHERRAVGTYRARGCRNHNKAQEVVMDWPYAVEGVKQHHTYGHGVESPGKETQRQTKAVVETHGD